MRCLAILFALASSGLACAASPPPPPDSPSKATASGDGESNEIPESSMGSPTDPGGPGSGTSPAEAHERGKSASATRPPTEWQVSTMRSARELTSIAIAREVNFKKEMVIDVSSDLTCGKQRIVRIKTIIASNGKQVPPPTGGPVAIVGEDGALAIEEVITRKPASCTDGPPAGGKCASWMFIVDQRPGAVNYVPTVHDIACD